MRSYPLEHMVPQMQTSRVGRVYGKLTVLEVVEKYKVICRCECGVEREFWWNHIRRGATRSCGCARGTVRVADDVEHSHSGAQKHELYSTWIGIKKRCLDPKHESFHRYGGRGVSMCQEWRLDFFSFVTAMGARPSPDHTVDRFPNHDGNYEPGNVRWATHAEQSANTDFCFAVTLDGERRASIQAARKLGLSEKAVKHARSQGFAPHEALAVAHLRLEAYNRRNYLQTEALKALIPARVAQLKLGPV